MKKFLILFFVLAFASSQNIYSAQTGDIVAKVNSSSITKTYVNKVLQEEVALLPQEQRTPENLQALATKIINQKIDEILIYDAAKKAKISATKQEIKNSVDSIKNRFRTEADFNADLKRQGLSKTEFENEVKENLIRVKYISEELKNRAETPDEEELKTFYNNVVSEMNGLDLDLPVKESELVSNAANNLKRVYSEQVKIRQIFIKYSDGFTKEQKKEVSEKIKELKKELSVQNMNFSQLSVKYSDDQSLRQKKGDIGFVLREDLTPEVSKVLFSLNVGAYNKSPLKTGNGYHFFRVEEKKAKMPVEFEDVRQYLSDTLYKYNVQNEYDKLLAELRENANIKFY